jgi:hypothetical protein
VYNCIFKGHVLVFPRGLRGPLPMGMSKSFRNLNGLQFRISPERASHFHVEIRTPEEPQRCSGLNLLWRLWMQLETVAAPHLLTTPIPGHNRDVHATDAVSSGPRADAPPCHGCAWDGGDFRGCVPVITVPDEPGPLVLLSKSCAGGGRELQQG